MDDIDGNEDNQYEFIIDAHCHMCDEQFDEDLDEVVENAKKNQVKACLVNTEQLSEFQKSLDLSERFPGFMIPCLGIHPVQFDDEGNPTLSAREEHCAGVEEFIRTNQDRIVAIGEVGLDFSPRYIKSPDDKESQRLVFKNQIDLSIELGLPLICHSRCAGKPVTDFLIQNGAKDVLLHAFDGSYKSAKRGIDAGYYFSVPPSIIRSDQKSQLFDKIPLSQILLETDSPVLGPTKEERNVPGNAIVSCEYVAKLKQLPLPTIMKETTKNAFRLFPRLNKMIKL